MNDPHKLAIAEEYLLERTPDSQEFEAALEHVEWVYNNVAEYRQAARALFKRVVNRRLQDPYFRKKVKGVHLS